MPELLESGSSSSSGSKKQEHDSFVITEGERDHDPRALSHQIQVADLVEKILQVQAALSTRPYKDASVRPFLYFDSLTSVFCHIRTSYWSRSTVLVQVKFGQKSRSKV